MKSVLKYLIIFILIFFILLPTYYLVVGIFTDNNVLQELFYPIISGEGFAKSPRLFSHSSLSSVYQLLAKTTNFYRAFWNSCKVVLPIVVLQTLIGAPCAWAFSHLKFPCKRQLYFLYIFLMILPFSVTMLSNYMLLKNLQLLDNYLSIILPASFSPLSVFIMERFFRKIPNEMLEASASCGASNFQTFVYIGIPLGLPGILSSMMYNFIKYWNDIEQPMLFLSSREKRTYALWQNQIDIAFVGQSFVSSALNAVLPVLIFVYGLRLISKNGDDIHA